MVVLVRFFESICILILVMGCSSAGSYTHYLVDPEISVNESFINPLGSKAEPILPKDENPLRVRFNDGHVLSEVEIPMISSGQRVFVQARKRKSNSDDKGPEFRLPPPLENDWVHRQLEEDYMSKGLMVEKSSPLISLTSCRDKMDEAVRHGQYNVAFRYATGVLKRYPQHPEFLRAAGSLALLLGEKERGISYYEKSLEVEYDASVERKLNEL